MLPRNSVSAVYRWWHCASSGLIRCCEVRVADQLLGGGWGQVGLTTTWACERRHRSAATPVNVQDVQDLCGASPLPSLAQHSRLSQAAPAQPRLQPASEHSRGCSGAMGVRAGYDSDDYGGGGSEVRRSCWTPEVGWRITVCACNASHRAAQRGAREAISASNPAWVSMAQPPANCGAAAGLLSRPIYRRDGCQRFGRDRGSGRGVCGAAPVLGVDLALGVSGVLAPCRSIAKVDGGRVGPAHGPSGCAGMRGLVAALSPNHSRPSLLLPHLLPIFRSFWARGSREPAGAGSPAPPAEHHTRRASGWGEALSRMAGLHMLLPRPSPPPRSHCRKMSSLFSWCR